VTFLNGGYSTAVTPVVGGESYGIPNVSSNVFSQSLIITRIMNFWGRTGGVSVILPHVDITTKAGPFQTGARGAGDIGFAWEINLFGAPALTREQMKTWKPETFASLHLVGTAPLGRYNAQKFVNTGANRWSFTPTINYSYTPDAGWTWLELYVSGKFFSENNDGFGGSRLSQRPVLALEGHASRNLTSDFWVSLDAYYDLGGETFRNGVGRNDAANTVRLGAGVGVRTWKGGQIMLNYDRTVAKPNSQPDGQSFRLSVAQVW
jgi:hypothetical protein